MITIILICLFVILFTTIAFGIHGGEMVTGVNRQIRNFICALPFGIILFHVTGLALLGVIAFVLAYIGTNMGFKDINGEPNFKWLPVKGLVTCFPLGAILLPIAYFIGNKTKWKNVFSEYFSGTLYGAVLAIILLFL